MRRFLGAIALVIAGTGAAHAKDRVLFSGTAKAIADGVGVKAKAACKVAITTTDADPCATTCAASVTCGDKTFALTDASCGPTPGLTLACKAAYRKRLFAALGSNGEIDVGDGYALLGAGDDDQVLAVAFTGGRAAGEPEGKPKTRLRETRALTFEGGVTMPVPTCTVELETYPDRDLRDACQMDCVAKVTCGPLRVTRVGTCEIPYFYTSNESKCYGEVVALTFDDANGAHISIGERDEDRSEGSFPLATIGTLTLAK